MKSATHVPSTSVTYVLSLNSEYADPWHGCASGRFAALSMVLAGRSGVWEVSAIVLP